MIQPKTIHGRYLFWLKFPEGRVHLGMAKVFNQRAGRCWAQTLNCKDDGITDVGWICNLLKLATNNTETPLQRPRLPPKPPKQCHQVGSMWILEPMQDMFHLNYLRRGKQDKVRCGTSMKKQTVPSHRGQKILNKEKAIHNEEIMIMCYS